MGRRGRQLDKLSRALEGYISLGLPDRPHPTGIKQKTLERAAVMRAPEPAPPAPPPVSVAPVASQGPSWPCCYITRGQPWDENRELCGQPSIAGHVYCYSHWTAVFRNPVLERLNVRHH